MVCDRVYGKAGVCVMLGFLYLLKVINWTMRTITKKRHRINWATFQVREDLEYADDLALSATDKQPQLKTGESVRVAATVVLQVNTKKSKVMSVALTSQQGITINGEEYDDVRTLTHLLSEINCALLTV